MPISEYEIHHDGQITKFWANDISDGYHTMSELYNHRHALFAALIRAYDHKITSLGPTAIRVWKSKLHSDGTMFEGWFIAGITRKNLMGEDTHITYHLPMSWWDHFTCMELVCAPEWDGHKSDDIIERLLKL